jgi:hypothetical protein
LDGRFGASSCTLVSAPVDLWVSSAWDFGSAAGGVEPPQAHKSEATKKMRATFTLSWLPRICGKSRYLTAILMDRIAAVLLNAGLARDVFF